MDSGVVDKELLDGLRGLGVSGLEGEVAYGGEGLCMTEIMRGLEEFSVNMALSEAVTVANTVAVAPLARYACRRLSRAAAHCLDVHLTTDSLSCCRIKTNNHAFFS